MTVPVTAAAQNPVAVPNGPVATTADIVTILRSMDARLRRIEHYIECHPIEDDYSAEDTNNLGWSAKCVGGLMWAIPPQGTFPDYLFPEPGWQVVFILNDDRTGVWAKIVPPHKGVKLPPAQFDLLRNRVNAHIHGSPIRDIALTVILRAEVQ